MERKNPYLKIAAVVSAVLLVGAFVSYRAGAFQRPAALQPQPATATPFDPEAPPASDADQQSKMFMYSSKSAPAFTPDLPPANPPAPGSPPTYMGGSKFITIVPAPADPPKPAPNAPTP